MLRVPKTTLEEAELVRDKLTMELQDYADVTGVGVVRLGAGYGVRVNVKTDALPPELLDALPPKLFGVPISIRVTGRIAAHHSG